MHDSTIAPPAIDPDRWVDEYGDYLFRYAFLRVSRRDVAEDLVQETFLAALRGGDSFVGQSAERTWLTGILNNKIVDRLRQNTRVRTESDLGADVGIDSLFDQSGHWRKPPREWGGDPCELLQRREFWEAFERCRGGLPERLREALSLRLIDGLDADVVCSALGITAPNLWTMLHRARVRLLLCMDLRGLNPKQGGKS